MSEATDLAIVLRGYKRRLEEHDTKLDSQDEAIVEIQRKMAIIDRAQQTFENQIEIFRGAINEGFQRMRRELQGGK